MLDELEPKTEDLSLDDLKMIALDLKNILSFYRGNGATFDQAWTSFWHLVNEVKGFLSGSTPPSSGTPVPVIPQSMAADLDSELDHIISLIEKPEVQQLGLGMSGVISMLLPVLKPLLGAMLSKLMEKLANRGQ